MSKKAFIIILVLGVVASYIASIIDALVSGTLIAGESGFPFKDSRGTLFGEGSVNNLMFILDIIFWFAVIWGIWKLIKNLQKK